MPSVFKKFHCTQKRISMENQISLQVGNKFWIFCRSAEIPTHYTCFIASFRTSFVIRETIERFNSRGEKRFCRSAIIKKRYFNNIYCLLSRVFSYFLQLCTSASHWLSKRLPQVSLAQNFPVVQHCFFLPINCFLKL